MRGGADHDTGEQGSKANVTTTDEAKVIGMHRATKLRETHGGAEE